MLRITTTTKKTLNTRQFLMTIRRSINTPTFIPSPRLQESDLNPHTLEAKYAVRGRIPSRAEEIRELLKDEKHSFDFDQIINVNIGNPQQLDQKPLTFYRQTLSLLQYPELLENPSISKLFPQDIIQRSKTLLKEIGSVGAYSHSQGVPYVRKSIANFITERDGEKAYAEDIFLTTGASTAVSYLLSVLSVGRETGFLIPIPQYPLYTASLTLNNTHAIPYYLDEAKDWSTDPVEIEQIVEENKANNVKVRALVIINPGNPTGAILSQEAIEEILVIAAKHGIVVIADEVYQENIFNGEFVSVKKVLRSLQKQHPGKFDNVQLASLHSTSKGISGECGQRGGYMEVVGFSPETKAVLLKLASISLCPVVTGQALVELMINPPKKGDESYDLYNKEKTDIHEALQQRSTALYHAFCNMEGVECNKPEGAMYLFPKIKLPFNAIQKAEHSGMEPDEYYCSELLESTGICAVPGSGFGQLPGTFHVRTTFLAPGTEWVSNWEKFHQSFMDKFRD